MVRWDTMCSQLDVVRWGRIKHKSTSPLWRRKTRLAHVALRVAILYCDTFRAKGSTRSLSKNGQCYNLIGELKFRARKVLGPRKSSNVTRRSFPRWVERLGTRLYIYIYRKNIPSCSQGLARSRSPIIRMRAAN